MDDFLEALDLLGLAVTAAVRTVRALRRAWEFATRLRPSRLFLSLLTVLVLLSACSSAQGQPPSSARVQGSASSPAPQYGFEAYRNCMRGYGVNIPPAGRHDGFEPLSSQYQAANRVCGPVLTGPYNPQAYNIMYLRLFRLAQCFNAYGVPMSYPVYGSKQLGIGVSDPRFSGSSAEYQKAHAVCGEIMQEPPSAVLAGRSPPPLH